MDHIDGKSLCGFDHLTHRNTMNTNIIIALSIFLAMVAGTLLGWYIRKMIERQEKMEKQIAELNEIANRRKLPYPAQAGLEDAIAIVIDVINNDEAADAYRQTRINQLIDRLKQVRSNPQGYDINQPDLQNTKNAKRN